MQHHNLRVAGLAAAVSLALQSAPAFSQLEEVIVTANKRSESLNEVGMTVSVLSEQTIEDRGLSSLEDSLCQYPV
jgi:outer membrane cobalamin receptor